MTRPLGAFRTAPIFKEKVWAGDRLQRFVPAAPPGTGEVWLVSDVEGNASVIQDGPCAGRTLRELMEERPAELVGDARADRFPVLVKLLDIAPPLSVQLHPNAEVARALGDGERGKCEAWLVLGRGAEGRVLIGVERELSADEVVAAAQDGRLVGRLSTVVPEPGEGLEIVPGTLHTAAELTVLEVQETSDVTYRVYDWGRGRELHLEQARAVLETVGVMGPPPREPAPGWAPGRRALAPRSPFRFDAVQLAAGESLALEGGIAEVVAVLQGAARVESAGEPLALGVGEAAVCPASLEGARVVAEGPVQLGYGAGRA